jgi:hypothetical protein
MKAARRLLTAAAAFLGGCAASPVTHRSLDPATSAAEQARREERLKLMQQFWRESTGAVSDPSRLVVPGPVPPLSYPAGRYGGLIFSPRVAAGPGLIEPPR